MTTATMSLDELEATLKDQSKIVELVNNGKLGQFLKDYADAKADAHNDVATQVKEETQRVLAQWLKDHGSTQRLNLTPDSAVGSLAAKRSKIYNANAPGAGVDKLVKNHGEFLQAIWHKSQGAGAGELQDKIHAVRNAFGSTVPSDGGFLIPETLRSELLAVALESSIVRSRARVIPMDSLRVPIPTIDDTSHASSVYGGMVGYWTEEAGALTDSSAKFGRVVLDAKKLTGYSEVPNELFQDAIGSFSALIEELWPEAISFFEDVAFLTGSGVGEPLGVRNAAAKITVTATASGNDIEFADVASMYSRMLPASLGRAVWIASIDTFVDLARLEVSTGSPAVWLNNGLAEGPPMTLLGRPVIFTEKMPAKGSAGQLSFVDFGYYLVGDRQVMQIETSPHYKFKNDQTAVRIIERVDGRPWLNSAITPANGGATLSPFVELGAD
ncbi:MAG: phage major capsid protein [Dehalococcoidia bacterium]|nr:MAG: phage major capsid protein [Dehalococcoidia bacterium]